MATVTLSMTTQDAEEAFEGALATLEVRSGSLLALRTGDSAETAARFAQSLRKVLYARNIDDVTILVLADSTSLESLDDEQMKHAGWVRAQ